MMEAPEKLDWDTCTEDDCIGVRLPSGGKCWAHADDPDLDLALKPVRRGDQLDARGVQFTQELLVRLLAAAPKDEHGRTILRAAKFEKATFEHADFGGVIFQSDASFQLATFEGTARFSGTTFQGEADFSGTTFADFAMFSRAVFHGFAQFNATFRNLVWFVSVVFHDDAWFGIAAFRRDGVFNRAVFQQDVDFAHATFQRNAMFREAIFHRAQQLGPLLVRKGLVLDQAVFHERAQVEVSAAAVCCRRTRFLAGVQLRLRWAQVVLDDADIAAPSILAGVPGFPDFDEGRWAQAVVRLRTTDRVSDRPRLVSLRRADVAGLTVSNLDLRSCRFLGAHNLDKLHVEASDFGYAPSGWRWTTRQTIAEERAWRVRRFAGPFAVSRGAPWQRPSDQPPPWLNLDPSPTPTQIAALYRALRKGREDNKDEPGAADFYYGEMEMRRHARDAQARRERRLGYWGTWATARTEHAVLWLYWLVSGYGLRAWRALALFLVLLVVAAGLFAFGGGFASSASVSTASLTTTTRPAPIATPNPPPTATATADTSFGGAIVYSARTVIGLTREPQPRLTRFGDVVQILIRIIGPVLLGLAVLSVRGRVKR
jgi:uncharacterized protein YjbI with pentapeptide repeats